MAGWVAILMGSSSDAELMKHAEDTLDELGVAHETHVLSAHRNAEALLGYVRDAEARGVSVWIAGAGMAAHLPGVIAGHSVKPVIGVPIASGGLGGMDSLLSIVQMPPGVPVACVAVGGARNAALLAVQILATGNDELAERFAEYKAKL